MAKIMDMTATVMEGMEDTEYIVDTKDMVDMQEEHRGRGGHGEHGHGAGKTEIEN